MILHNNIFGLFLNLGMDLEDMKAPKCILKLFYIDMSK